LDIFLRKQNQKMNINLINFLILLKNASLAKKESIYCKYNRNFEKLLKVLYLEGIIQSYYIINSKSTIRIFFRYTQTISRLNLLKIISNPSKSCNISLKNLYKISEGQKVLVLSTSKGVLTSLKAKKNYVGGTLLFVC
jgi:small subunit ribosomal protein S8